MLTQIVDSASRLILVRLNPGDDVLHSIAAAAGENGVRHALILSGIGSLSSYHFHVVETTELPPGNLFVRGEGPFDILSVTGFVLDGRVHAHITFSNTERAVGGHLEEGCRILTFGVVVMADVPDADIGDWDHVGPL
jgi:predicted DNA-binding protein with PD1-like motif